MIRSEELRALLLEFLKAFPDEQQLQFPLCMNGVEKLVRDRCVPQSGSSVRQRQELGAPLKHVVWDLILERVLGTFA